MRTGTSSALLQVMTLGTLYLAGRIAALGGWYLAGLLAGAALFAHQLWLIRERVPAECFRGFLNNNYFGMAVFIGIALDYLFR